ncbi:MAG: hypothetical protein LJE84_06175, partial [Gammaproteobacteria bacterium]|nr:hypothetical protein [Gammaproteobacteria bacterium]
MPNRSSWTWQRSASLLLPAILLGACASLEKAPAPESTAGPPPEVEPAYPDLELTPELMYEVLVGEVASQRNQFGVSADALAQAAESTRDPRLLEAAIRAALRAQRPVVALETARTWAATVPKNRRAHEILATLEAREGRVDASLAGFLAALSLYPQEERADAYLHFANLLSRVEKAPSLAVMQSLS